MIEHLSLPVHDFGKAKEFYTSALKPLGYKLAMEFGEEAAGFMAEGHTSFWIVKKPHGEKIHVAFRAPDKEAVHHFYDAGMKAGARDNGKPGPRKDYSPDYYAAFVLDPEGNNIEAVFYDKDQA